MSSCCFTSPIKLNPAETVFITMTAKQQRREEADESNGNKATQHYKFRTVVNSSSKEKYKACAGISVYFTAISTVAASFPRSTHLCPFFHTYGPEFPTEDLSVITKPQHSGAHSLRIRNNSHYLKVTTARRNLYAQEFLFYAYIRKTATQAGSRTHDLAFLARKLGICEECKCR